MMTLRILNAVDSKYYYPQTDYAHEQAPNVRYVDDEFFLVVYQFMIEIR
jgi:hypothetical protein